LLVTANVVPSSPILVTLMKEALSSSETSVLTRATRRNIPEDAVLHIHYRVYGGSSLVSHLNQENLTSHTGSHFLIPVIIVFHSLLSSTLMFSKLCPSFTFSYECSVAVQFSAMCVECPTSHNSRFANPYNIWRGVEMYKMNNLCAFISKT
jgi:hypothetical protein